MADVVALHKVAFSVLQDAGATFSADPFAGIVETGTHSCFCGDTFLTKRGLLAHQRRKHQIFSLERRFLQGAICMHCGRFCWTTQRLQQHLAYIPKMLGYNPCFQALSAQGRDVTYELARMPKAVLGLARRECLQTAGPQNAHVTILSQQRYAWELEREDCMRQLVIEAFPPFALDRGEQLGDALTEATVSWVRAHFPQGSSEAEKQALIDTWIQILCVTYGENNPDWDNWLAFVFLAWGDHWLPEVVAEFLDGEAEYVVDELYAQFAFELPRYQLLARVSALDAKLRHCVEEDPVPHRPPVGTRSLRQHPKTTSKVCQPVSRAFADQVSWIKHMHSCTMVELPPATWCPRYNSIADAPVFLVVHLFSGRRRCGDFHQQLHLLAESRRWNVIILSLDTAVSLEFGNLLQGTTSWAELQVLYQAGKVAATLCGPPCETFSEARFMDAPDSSVRWPRPLRSAARLFGLEGLTLRELRQCSVGSAFFLQCMWVLCIHITQGGLFVAEHPALPTDCTRPSIWSSPLVRLLLRIPELKLHRISQYRWGAAVVKPTGLLAWNLPFFHIDLYKKANCDAIKPSKVAIGIDEHGNFNTSCHKEYPPQFCLALAYTFAQQFDRLVCMNQIRTAAAAHEKSDEWVQAAAHVSATIRADAQWLSDLQPF